MSEDYKKPFIPLWMDQAGFTPHQYRVHSHLWSRGQGTCFPSLETIAACCKMNIKTVKSAIKDLEVLGYVQRKKRKAPGVRFSNEYILTGPNETPLTSPNQAPVKIQPAQMEPRLTGPNETPANRPKWSPGNDTSLNDTSLNDSSPSGEGVLAIVSPDGEGSPGDGLGSPPDGRRSTNEASLFPGEILPMAEKPSSKKSRPQELADAIWKNTPPKGRERSSKKQLEDALRKIPAKDLPSESKITSALEAWKASESWTKDGGQYVAGIHRWANERKWESPPEPAAPPTAGCINGKLPTMSTEEAAKLLGRRAPEWNQDQRFTERHP